MKTLFVLSIFSAFIINYQTCLAANFEVIDIEYKSIKHPGTIKSNYPNNKAEDVLINNIELLKKEINGTVIPEEILVKYLPKRKNNQIFVDITKEKIKEIYLNEGHSVKDLIVLNDKNITDIRYYINLKSKDDKMKTQLLATMMPFINGLITYKTFMDYADASFGITKTDVSFEFLPTLVAKGGMIEKSVLVDIVEINEESLVSILENVVYIVSVGNETRSFQLSKCKMLLSCYDNDNKKIVCSDILPYEKINLFRPLFTENTKITFMWETKNETKLNIENYSISMTDYFGNKIDEWSTTEKQITLNYTQTPYYNPNRICVSAYSNNLIVANSNILLLNCKLSTPQNVNIND